MPSTNVSRIGLALQTAKGSRAANVQWWLDVTGGRMRPAPNVEQRSTTGLGVDVGEQFVSMLSSSGDPAFLLMRKTAPLIYYGLLGAKAHAQLGTAWSSGQTYTLGQLIKPTAGGKLFEVTTAGSGGTTEPTWASATTIGQTVPSSPAGAVYTYRQSTDMYEHTITPANDKPYFTVWVELGDSLYEVYQDVKFTGGNLEFPGGGDLALSTGLQGLAFERLTASPSGGTPVYDTGYEPFRRPGSVLKIGGTQDTSIASGNINIDWGQNLVQTDGIYPSYNEPGGRNITFGVESVWSTVARYAQINYGDPVGVTPLGTIFETDLDFKFGPDYGPQIRFIMQRAKFLEANANPDPAANPLMLSIAGGAGRVSAGSIIEVRVRNSQAGTVYAP